MKRNGTYIFMGALAILTALFIITCGTDKPEKKEKRYKIVQSNLVSEIRECFASQEFENALRLAKKGLLQKGDGNEEFYRTMYARSINMIMRSNLAAADAFIQVRKFQKALNRLNYLEEILQANDWPAPQVFYDLLQEAEDGLEKEAYSI